MIAEKDGNESSRITVYVYDQAGNAVPNVKVGFSVGKKEALATTNNEGQIDRLQLTPDKYQITAKASHFKTQTIKNVEIKTGFETRLIILLDIRSEDTITVGIYASDETMIDPTRSSVTTVISSRKISLIPND